MNRPVSLVTLLVVIIPVALPGCTSERAYIRDGNADSVNISYRGDIASALSLAKKHCAQFERVPQFIEADTELASFDCRRP